MKKCMLAATIGLIALTGCLPIELDVTPTGEILIPRGEGFFAYNPATGKVTEAYATTASPIFALAVPQRGGLIAISDSSGGNTMGAGMQIEYVDPNGKGKTIANASNVTYAQVSADGKRLSFTRVADQSSEGFDQNLPELKVLSTEGGAVTKLVSNVGMIYRWMPDGKSLVVMKLDSKDEENDLYTGRIALVDSKSGKLTDLAAAVGPQEVFLDVSPDGAKVLFTALASDKAGAELKVNNPDDAELKLYELDVKTRAVKEVWQGANFAMYSPKQTKVLIGEDGEDETLELYVTDPSFNGKALVANDAAKQAGGMANSVDIYPSWYDDQTVLYIAKKAVFGTAGENFMLATVKADGSQRKLHQAKIDAAASN